MAALPKTHVIPSELLFDDRDQDIRLELAELEVGVELTPVNAVTPLAMLIANGNPAGVFQNARLARLFSMQLESMRELAHLVDAVTRVTLQQSPAEFLAALRALGEQAKRTHHFLDKANRVAKGEAPGRVTQ